MRLIDADALTDKITGLYTEEEGATEGDKVINNVIDIIDEAPTLTNIDVIKEFPSIVNSPRGVWEIVDDDDGLKLCECSICGRREEIINFKNYPFCHCGAQMSPGGNK